MRDKIRFIVFIHIFIIHSCKQNEEKWKILDADSFTIEVPNHFRYEEKKAIDSAVGEIIGDSLRILFDFGYYTDQEPRTNEEFAEKMIFRGDLLKEVRSKLNLPDTFSHKNFLKQIIIETLDTITWIATVKYRDTLIYQPITMYWYDDEDDRRNYLFSIDSIGEWRRKIFYPKNRAAERSGIVLRKYNDGSLSDYIALGLSIYNAQEKDSVKIMRMLKSIRIKE